MEDKEIEESNRGEIEMSGSPCQRALSIDENLPEEYKETLLYKLLDECTRKSNPLHLAAQHGHFDFVREFLLKKRELACELNSQGQSPLHLASARGHAGVVQEILKVYPDACFVRDRDGMIPLHLAAVKGRLDVLEKLLTANIKTAFILTEKGEPILHLCAKNNQFKALEKLVELFKKASRENLVHFVNLKDNDDNTILHTLSLSGGVDAKVISIFAGNHRIDANAVNKDGHTPLDVSLLNENGLEFARLKVQFWLVLCGVRLPKLNRIISTINPERMFDGNDGKWFVEALLVVSVLMVTVAFQAGINPPGGVWQDNGYHNATLHINASQSSAVKLVHHYAGQSVMSYVDPIRYKYFSLFNNITLSSSMLVIIMLLRSWHLSHWIFKLSPIVATFISVWAMSTTYSISVSFIASVGDSHSVRREITSTMSLLLLGIFFIAYLVNILRASCLLIILSIQKLYQKKMSIHKMYQKKKKTR